MRVTCISTRIYNMRAVIILTSNACSFISPLHLVVNQLLWLRSYISYFITYLLPFDQLICKEYLYACLSKQVYKTITVFCTQFSNFDLAKCLTVGAFVKENLYLSDM